MTVNANILDDCTRRGITRLCHFTPSRNLIHVLASGYLKDRLTLDTELLDEVNPTDEYRLDGHRDKICCSVEYPNSYYLDIVTKKELIFLDWVILFIDPVVLWSPGTLFCPRNAAAENGALIAGGWPGYESMFLPRVQGTGGRSFKRQASHLSCSPTDMQAEVLVPGPIPIDAIRGMAMRTEKQVKTERARWDTLGLSAPTVPTVVAPVLFDKIELRQHIWTGRRPAETAV
ncbi:DarT ssDNA thymidine ADP-ribosyltransferase family protein [Burkholderia sp. MSMB1459WGS]|uniref:DarT ssDNA thymidine ADP-ribosyltransferase family protein n=1 Tax=Burkholderia sp. MSMB1459WGS TaxID=1637970 RepID=UPI0009E7F4AB